MGCCDEHGARVWRRGRQHLCRVVAGKRLWRHGNHSVQSDDLPRLQSWLTRHHNEIRGGFARGFLSQGLFLTSGIFLSFILGSSVLVTEEKGLEMTSCLRRLVRVCILGSFFVAVPAPDGSPL